MPPPVAAKKDDQNPNKDPNEVENPEEAIEEEEPIEGPPDEDFDEKYNKHLEFPISIVAAILLHVFGGAFVVFVLLGLLSGGDDKSCVPMKLVAVNGMDDNGEGSAGSGGVEDPFIKADGDPDRALMDSLPDIKLPEVKQDMQKTIKYLDPTGNLPISDANAAAYNNLNE